MKMMKQMMRYSGVFSKPIATLTAERDQLLADIAERDRTYLAVQKAEGLEREKVELERDALRTALEAADNIFRAITDGWGALQAIGPTHEQLAAYVSASRALGGKS